MEKVTGWEFHTHSSKRWITDDGKLETADKCIRSIGNRTTPHPTSVPTSVTRAPTLRPTVATLPTVGSNLILFTGVGFGVSLGCVIFLICNRVHNLT